MFLQASSPRLCGNGLQRLNACNFSKVPTSRHHAFEWHHDVSDPLALRDWVKLICDHAEPTVTAPTFLPRYMLRLSFVSALIEKETRTIYSVHLRSDVLRREAEGTNHFCAPHYMHSAIGRSIEVVHQQQGVKALRSMQSNFELSDCPHSKLSFFGFARKSLEGVPRALWAHASYAEIRDNIIPHTLQGTGRDDLSELRADVQSHDHCQVCYFARGQGALCAYN